MLRRDLLFAAFAMIASQPTFAADEPPTSPEAKRIEALVNKAAALVDEKGKDAFAEFRKPGTVLLNPAFPAREGHNYHGETDKKGKAFHDELQNVARTKGSGWIDYWLPKPGQTEPSHKWSYVRRVKAEGVLLVGAGFFPE